MKALICSLIIIKIFFAQSVQAKEASLTQGFQSDMCTSSPNGSWGHCCYEHDLLYWVGGSFEQRKIADDQIMKCMNLSNGPGHIYREFVRTAGTQFWSSAWENNNMNLNIGPLEMEMIQNEYELWTNLGRPRDFDFVMQESILFLPLSISQKKLILKEVNKIKKTKSYQDFLKTYTRVTGTRPLIESNFL